MDDRGKGDDRPYEDDRDNRRVEKIVAKFIGLGSILGHVWAVSIKGSGGLCLMLYRDNETMGAMTNW